MTITTYLLHFPNPVNGCSHYIGTVQTGLFFNRMKAHAGGYGGNTTLRLVAANPQFYITRTWQTASRDKEKRLKKNGHYERLCPLCSEIPNLPDATKIIRSFDPITQMTEKKRMHTLSFGQMRRNP